VSMRTFGPAMKAFACAVKLSAEISRIASRRRPPSALLTILSPIAGSASIGLAPPEGEKRVMLLCGL